jgi:two-component system OmpR family response regulator
MHFRRKQGLARSASPRRARTEYELLRFFLRNPRRVLTRAQILEGVWGDSAVEPGEVETYVSYLRRKLDPHGPPLIHTFRSFGYALRSPA